VHAGNVFVTALIAVDSTLLFARVAGARVRALGLVAACSSLAPTTRTVCYVDCGLHKQGEQVRWIREWFGDRCDLRMVGIEASAEHMHDAETALADVPNLHVLQVALIGPDDPREKVALHRGSEGGKADSLYGSGADVEMVPADRLSNVIRREFSDALDGAPLLVRMNIEGSELDVIEDLVRAGLDREVDGWFGMWDDVGKRDRARDRRFRRLVADAGITTVTFNDRDLRHPLRRRAIKLAADTAIRRGLQRKPADRRV
jgi:hypothetical protein